ncbi:unnamed protein product [Anisakis simplex]|uniref:Uncharacterized protein n=1 Tax=Anisakis simplex TaxID=6269 RepID=A0A0M3JWM0_ANISI|nr:unnamed protein product [Anisakis simplex]
MLGMMNAGGETPADFFSPMRPSSLFKKHRYLERAKETLSYASDGRLLIDGHPIVQEDPEDLWAELIIRVIAYRIRGACKSNTKPPSFWKRISTKLLTRSVSVKDELILNSEHQQLPKDHEGFVTTIKVTATNSPMQQKISFNGRRITT